MSGNAIVHLGTDSCG